MIDVSRLFHRFVKTIRDHALVIDDGITRQSTQVFRCTLYAVHVQKGVTEEGGIKRNKEKKNACIRCWSNARSSKRKLPVVEEEKQNL